MNASFSSISLEALSDDELLALSDAIQKIRASRASFHKETELDALTGLCNKETFERLVRKQLSESEPQTVSVLFCIDIDNFTQVNSALEATGGNVVLHDFAEVLKRLFRPGDVMGRIGEDEFAVFLHNIPDCAVAEQKATRILQAASHLLLGVETIKISASVGIAASPQHGTEYEALFSVAECAVSNVKRAGRNGYCFGSGAVVRT